MSLRNILLVTISFFIVGCSNSTQNINNSVKLDEKPKYQVPKKVEAPKPRAKGSLFSNQGASLFSDRKTLQVGDIVYVLINEGTQGTTEKTGKTRTAETGGTLFQEQVENTRSIEPLGVTANSESPGLLKSIIKGINGLLGISLSTGDGKSLFKTDSSTTAIDELVNDIAAIITEYYQNGNYFIEGEKNIIVKGQRVTLKLSGVMNPQDLNKDSEINSNRIANLKVMLYKTGTEADLDEKPWGTKIIDTITPF